MDQCEQTLPSCRALFSVAIYSAMRESPGLPIEVKGEGVGSMDQPAAGGAGGIPSWLLGGTLWPLWPLWPLRPRLARNRAATAMAATAATPAITPAGQSSSQLLGWPWGAGIVTAWLGEEGYSRACSDKVGHQAVGWDAKGAMTAAALRHGMPVFGTDKQITSSNGSRAVAGGWWGGGGNVGPVTEGVGGQEGGD